MFTINSVLKMSVFLNCPSAKGDKDRAFEVNDHISRCRELCHRCQIFCLKNLGRLGKQTGTEHQHGLILNGGRSITGIRYGAGEFCKNCDEDLLMLSGRLFQT